MKLLQEFIDNKKLYYAYEYTLNYIYTLIRMFTGYRIRSIFLLVLLFLFSILIFFFYKEFYTLILKDPLLGISLILILCGYISYLQFNLGCRIIITLTKGIPHFLHVSAKTYHWFKHGDWRRWFVYGANHRLPNPLQRWIWVIMVGECRDV